MMKGVISLAYCVSMANHDYMIDLNIYVEDYYIYLSSYCSDSSIIYYKKMLNYFLIYYNTLSNYDFNKLGINYVVYLRNKNIKNVTIKSYIRGVKNYFNYLYFNGYIFINPFSRLKLPRNDSRLVVPLSKNNVSDISVHLSGKYRLLFFLMLDCGLRVSEAISLLSSDVNIQDKYIIVRCSKFNKSRTLPISDKLIYMFKPYLNNKYVFQVKNSHLTYWGVSSYFVRLNRKINIHIYPHLLRHTFATSYLYYGGNLEYLRLLLGHSDLDATKNYLHLTSVCLSIGYDIYNIFSDNAFDFGMNCQGFQNKFYGA